MKTILKNRVIWYDGAVTFTPDQLLDYVLTGGVITPGIHIDALTEDVKSFNRLNPTLSVNVKKDMDHLDQTWNIPDHYKQINIKSFVHKKLLEHVEKNDGKPTAYTEEQINQKIERVEKELELYKSFGMNIILKTIIYIIDIFKQNKVVWGTGRGSSCSSYILYLIGLHSVDSIKYDLDLNEFFR